MNLGKIIFFALIGAYFFGITIAVLGWGVKTLAELLTLKAPRVRNAFYAISDTTGNNNQDALIALVVYLPIWLPSAVFVYCGSGVNASTDEKIGNILGILGVMAIFLKKVAYSQKR
jgi:hypothetical protein